VSAPVLAAAGDLDLAEMESLLRGADESAGADAGAGAGAARAIAQPAAPAARRPPFAPPRWRL